ncbi:MAG: hypothetical protein IT445_02940 [Phycisphaeraceae bacterium]|nr:hypothetical protein [Phycisphaeraceae bacterium]
MQQVHPEPIHRLRRWLVPLIVLLALAGALRLYHLGQVSFAHDEMYHFMAAQSLIAVGHPDAPPRGDYWRAYPITWLTRWSMTWLEPGEWSARVPFVAINLLFLVVMFVWARRQFGLATAAVALLMLGLSPVELRIGRECRMYALFQLTFFLTALAAYQALESHPDAAAARGRAVTKLIVWTLVAAGLWAMSVWLQLLALNLVIALVCYGACMMVYRGLTEGLWRGLLSTYSLLLGLLLIAAVVAVIVRPELPQQLMARATVRLPEERPAPAVAYYTWMFTHYFSVLLMLLPLGCVMMVRRFGRLGLFLCCCFVPLMLAHLFLITARVAERYLVYILPFFVLLSSYPLALGLRQLWRLCRRSMRRERLGYRLLLAGGLLIASNILLQPWLSESLIIARFGHRPNWQHLSWRSDQEATDALIVSTSLREMSYYAGCVPDVILSGGFEVPAEATATVHRNGQDTQVLWIDKAEDLRKLIDQTPHLVIVVPDWALTNTGFLTPEMVNLLQSKLTAQPDEGEPRIMIYRSAPQGA